MGRIYQRRLSGRRCAAKGKTSHGDKIPYTVTYDTREESNQNLGIGLGCNGVIDVLIEPIDAGDANNAALFFESILTWNTPVALATVFASTEKHLTGKKILLKQNAKESTQSDEPLEQHDPRRPREGV